MDLLRNWIYPFNGFSMFFLYLIFFLGLDFGFVLYRFFGVGLDSFSLCLICFMFFFVFNGLIRYVFIVIYGVWNHRSMSDLVNFSWKEKWGCYEENKNGEPARTMYLLTEGEVAKILICGILGDWDFTQWLQLPKSNWMIPDEIPQLPVFWFPFRLLNSVK